MCPFVAGGRSPFGLITPLAMTASEDQFLADDPTQSTLNGSPNPGQWKAEILSAGSSVDVESGAVFATHGLQFCLSACRLVDLLVTNAIYCELSAFCGWRCSVVGHETVENAEWGSDNQERRNLQCLVPATERLLKEHGRFPACVAPS